MKEFEYKNIKGFEDTNTPNQLDNFELLSAKGLKDRYIFDFSRTLDVSGDEIINDPTTPGADYRYFYGWNNLTFFSNNYYTASVGNPGDAFLIKKGFSNKTNIAPSFSKVLSINSNDESPLFEENLAIYLDGRVQNAFGLGEERNDVKYFRSGYIELTFKTQKQNCIIAYGSGKLSTLIPTTAALTGAQATEISYKEEFASVNNNIAYTTEAKSEINELIISLDNGKIKLSYIDDYGNNAESFSLIGNQNVADNQWHHLVINIGKPGIIRQHGKKNNQKFIEFWIDGNLDLKTTNYLNKNQIFFPIIEWLGINPVKAFVLDKKDAWKTYDSFQSSDIPKYIGYDNPAYIYQNAYNGIFNESSLNEAFFGSIHTFVSGINTALNQYEIQQRNRLYRGYEKNEVDVFTLSAELVQPIITSNKKKVLKLFWNNLVQKNAKNGLEMDNNFDVYSYSTTHKIFNSLTETNNIDLSNNKELKVLSDVKVVLKDNIVLWNPGIISLDHNHLQYGIAGKSKQWNMYDNSVIDSFYIDENGDAQQKQQFRTSSLYDLKFSGIDLLDGDRILLTNQYNKKDNGIWIFNGFNQPLTRADDSRSAEQLNNAIVRIKQGFYKDTTWILSNTISSLNDHQDWVELEYHPDSLNINSQPIFLSRWQENNKEERFIDLQQDLNINNYDLIIFMNYPETNEQIKEHFVGYDDFEITKKYNNFINSLKTVVANGASLYVSSPRLAMDLGIVKNYIEIPQLVQESDAASASLSPFELAEPAERYFDTHRNNKYHVATTITGLTNKETYILTDFVNFMPETEYDYDQYHAKYSYRQFGLQEGNEFIIPGTALRKVTQNEKLPGFKDNQIGTKNIFAVNISDILAGTMVTKFANTYYNGSAIVDNPYDEYVTTIVVHNGQLLGTTPINGKIFVNCAEDGYTFSREEYNKAMIQVLPQNDINETVATRAWQYSTTRLNRLPQRVNVSALTLNGQTTPTDGGGGAFIQASSNSSNGIIRSKTDKDNVDYQSDLYPTIEEEIYPLQEIPVLSMTWLGLQWLVG